jgi:energy-converting hydrogenase A subunit R
MVKVICFDLEGPLSPQDNAYEVMGLIQNGHNIFEVLSRYDDILTLEGKTGYEPGDTLSLIVPFLVRHKITEEDIIKVSNTALIVNGVAETINSLTKNGWIPYIISTSYEYHAHNIARKIGIPLDRVYSTKLPIKKYIEESDKESFGLVDEAQKDILTNLYPNLDDEEAIKKRLDRFFWTELPKTKLGKFMSEVKVVGGQRKVDSAIAAARENNLGLKDIMAVGDSITDYKMLSEVNKAGGVGVVFNGNQYSIPYATVGLASTDMRMILAITNGFRSGGRSKAVEVVRAWEEKREEFLKEPNKIPDKFAPKEVKKLLTKKTINPYFHYLAGSDKKKQDTVLALHKKARAEVRGAAAKLG